MKNALFLGGTKGLGLSLSEHAIADEYCVFIAGRSAKSCPLINGRTIHAVPLDLEATDPRPADQVTHLPAMDIIVWSAGVYQEGPFIKLFIAEIDRYCRNHLQGPVTVLLRLLQKNAGQNHPCQLVVIGSSSAYTSRVDESLYDALKASKAHLARALGKELPRDIPGSKVLLVNPGGMDTPFWDGRDRDVSKFMRPKEVASVIWTEIREQHEPFKEIRIVRQSDRSPSLEFGPRMPE